ncbi:transposase [Heyndrickxia ginsengihumi]|uniref:transposase n=1 Tax=Heyndrickxia ginsengihumi TaxID=363870 RepID=UPI00203F53C7|nr:transposase [Heyndrickxia ginsengihumi]MCM3024060.1 transposase [Heyndrickxia ginsengihumi]
MYWQKHFDEPSPDEEIKKEIKDIVDKHKGNYGYRQLIWSDVRGLIVNHKITLALLVNRTHVSLVNLVLTKERSVRLRRTLSTEIPYKHSASKIDN